MSPRVHIAIGPTCNNHCIFCMEADREKRARVNGALTPEQVRRILEENRGAEEACFTSGEPTLVEALPCYAGWARELGYQRISVSTNGRRLAYRACTDQLVRAGVNLFNISVHGHHAKLHDGLVRTPGAFAQAMMGLANVAGHFAEGVRLHTCTVVTKRNLPHLGDIYRTMRAAGAHQVVFNVPQPYGRADQYFAQLVPSYSAIAAAFAACLEQAAEPEAPTFLVDIPPCSTEEIPAFNRGWVEAYVHHEVPQDNGRSRGGQSLDLVEKRRADFDQAERRKRPECRTCRYDASCVGVWAGYLARYGWDGLAPVRGRP